MNLNTLLIALSVYLMGCSLHKAEANSPVGYVSVVDSIKNNHFGEELLYCDYFLYDITEDSVPELWIKVGTCEADTKLLTYTVDNGCVSKIYEGDGGHSDYFIYDNKLICVMCNTGVGVVITYDYDGKQVIDSVVEFSTWNDEGKALSENHGSIADAKLSYWEDNYGNYIQLKPL